MNEFRAEGMKSKWQEPITIEAPTDLLLHMDRILVFDKGKINEDGTHSELLSKAGLYKHLWDAQVGGFLVDDQMEDEV